MRDTTNANTLFFSVASQDIIFYEPRNTYPFIELTNKLADLNIQTILSLPDKVYWISPLDTICTIVRFIKGTIFNGTDDTLNVTTGIGGTIIAIQEAKNEKGTWQPIEYWFNDRCGNSISSIALNPNEFINFYFPRYYGSFKTKLRLRLLLGTKTLISNEWDGRIEKKQFVKPKESEDKNLKIYYSFLD